MIKDTPEENYQHEQMVYETVVKDLDDFYEQYQTYF